MEREEVKRYWNLRYAYCISVGRESDFSKTWRGFPLTPGLIYELINIQKIPFHPSRPFEYSGDVFVVRNDIGEIGHYSDEVFRYLNKEEIRELKLNELGI